MLHSTDFYSVIKIELNAHRQTTSAVLISLEYGFTYQNSSYYHIMGGHKMKGTVYMIYLVSLVSPISPLATSIARVLFCQNYATNTGCYAWVILVLEELMQHIGHASVLVTFV